MKLSDGAAFDEAQVRAAQKALQDSGYFQQVLISAVPTTEGYILKVKVSERPTISKLEILGATAFTKQELENAIGMHQNSPLDLAAIEQAKNALLNKYYAAGYYFASVNVDKKLLEQNVVIFRIVEGPASIVNKVTYDGNNYFSNLSLRLKTDTKAKAWPFIEGKLNREKVDRDVTVIRNLYVAEGFLDVEVGRRLDFSDDKSTVKVVFEINEGRRYRVNRVIIQGNRVFSTSDLTRGLNLHQNSFFTQDGLQSDLRILQARYGEQGYINANVTCTKQHFAPGAKLPEWAKNVDGGNPGLINLVYQIHEGSQYKIGEIRLKGNSITKDNVILREIKAYPGQNYNTIAVDGSKSRLQQTRLFDNVTITPTDSGTENVKNVLVEVKEGRTAEFLVGVGVSSSSGLLGTVSFTQRNFDILAWPRSLKDWTKPQTFKGAGQTFSIKAEPGTELMRFSVSWSTPYIFDQPYSFGSKGYVNDRSYDGYDERRVGVQAQIGHRFPNRWYGELSTRLENVDITVDSDAVEILADNGVHNLLGFRGTLVRDTTDSRWKPTTGDRFSFSYEQVVGTETFGRFTANYRKYKTVYIDEQDRKYILAGRVSFGAITGEAPVHEKFYGGGIGTIRGFRYRGIGPRGTRYDGTMSDDPIGGDMQFYAGGEFSFPIFGDKLRGVAFVDAGTVEADIAFNSLRVSAGIGLRIQLPLFGPVPMALDFGFPLLKEDYDETQVLSFSLGWTF